MTEQPRSPEAPPPGALTAVMRTATPLDAPRALRVGLVHRGRVLEERVFETGEHVTVGPNEHATFVVTGSPLPPGFRLFESTREGFSLHLTPALKGRLSAAGAVTDLAAPPRSSNTASNRPAIPLPHDARGRIQVGDHVLLFQLVTPAPKPRSAPLTPDLKATFGDVDWRTSIVAAFSFLVHFGAVGSVYSDWMDPVVDDEVDTAQLLETVKQLPPAPPLEKPTDTPATTAAAASNTPSPNTPPRPSGASAGGGPAGNSGPRGAGRAGLGDARAHQIAGELARLDMAVLMGLDPRAGSATQAVLGPGTDLPMGMLDKAASSAMGARPGLPGIDFGTSGAPFRPGTLTRGPGPGPGDTTLAPVTAGSAVTVKPVTGNVPTASAVLTTGSIANAASVVAGMTPGFRRCYNVGLRNENPEMRGSVRFTVKVGTNGEVQSVSASSSGSISPSVVSCMRGRVSSAQFSPPDGGAAILVIPVTVLPQ